MDPRLTHIRDWIFDLDNCLYPATSRLFDLIDQRMTAYIERLLDVDSDESPASAEDAFPRVRNDSCWADEAPRRGSIPFYAGRPRYSA